jgi:hypothetical protein
LGKLNPLAFMIDHFEIGELFADALIHDLVLPL